MHRYSVASSWLRETFLKENIDLRGRLMVDTKLRVKGHINIFAIGDITGVPELKQGYLADAHAGVVAKNLKLLMNGESETKLSSYKQTSAATLVSLGRREGVAKVMGITLAGCIPGKIKSGDLFVGKTKEQLGLHAD